MNQLAQTIAELRVLVGYLGEKGQANWWGSEFFGPTAAAFLSPIFNRSLSLAQYQGVTAAATKVHDEAIGVGRIYHLFRLPIGLEQAASEMFSDTTFVDSLKSHLANREAALSRLGDLAAKGQTATPGPVSLGPIEDDLLGGLKRAAGMYHSALNGGLQSFPYLREAE